MTEEQRIDAIKELARPLSLEGRGRAAREIVGHTRFTGPFWLIPMPEIDHPPVMTITGTNPATLERF